MLRVPPITSSPDPFIVTRDDLRPSNVKVKDPLYKRVWRVVNRVIRKFLNHFTLRKESTPFDLSRRQIRLINQAQAARTPAPAAVPMPVQHDIPDEFTEPTLSTTVASHPEPLERLKEFLQAFAQITVNECVYEDICAPEFPEWKNTLTELVESIPDFNAALIKLKDSIAPLMKNVKTADDPAFTLILQQLLKHYIQSDKETVKAELLDNLRAQKQTGNIDEQKYNKAVKFLDPILTWLYHPNNWIVRSTQTVNLHHFISDSFRFLDALSAKIREGELADFFEKILSFIDEDFDAQIKEAFELNTKPVTQLLSTRLADIVEKLPYTEAYDQLLSKIVEHMEGWTYANRVRNEQEKLVDDASKADSAHATNVSQIERQQTAQRLLDLVRADGGREPYLHNEFLRAFCARDVCHPTVGKSVEAANPEEEEKIDLKFYEDLIENLFPVFLPKMKRVLPHGLQIEVNGISDIINKLVFPDKIEELREEAVSVFEEVLESSQVKDKDNFREYFFALTHLVIVEYIQFKVKHVLSLELHKLFKRLASKEYLDYLIVEYIFPSLLEKTLEGFIRTHIERNSSQIGSAFQIIFENGYDIEDETLPLYDQLFQSVGRDLMDFRMEQEGITKEDFIRIVKPVLREIHDFISDKKTELDVEILSRNQVRSILRDYFRFESVSVNHDYGRLIMNALFKIGSFGGWFSEKIIGWCQGTLSDVTSQTLHPIRENYEMLVDSIVESASVNLLSADAIRENLFVDELSAEEKARQNAQVERELPRQIRRISALAHDSIYRSLESRSEPWIQHFTPSTTKIDGVITDVYNRLLGDQKLNESLLLSATEIIKASLHRSVEQMEASTISE